MKSVAIVALGVAVAAAHDHPVNHQIVNELKKTASWQVADVHENQFANMSLEDIQGLMGTILDYQPVDSIDETPAVGVPDNYNFYEANPDCANPVRNQARCGSCWAFGAAEALEDRWCLATGEHLNMSTQDMVSCDRGNMGCNGGYLSRAWSYLKNSGDVEESCWAYVSGDGHVPACAKKCDAGSGLEWNSDKHYCKDTVNKRTVASIQQEIYENGPMETGFMVYQDFMSYRGGIYKHTTGGFMGGHAVEIVGWGQEGSDKYWICKNSWGTSWGEQGFFRIAFNQVGINSDVWACNVNA